MSSTMQIEFTQAMLDFKTMFPDMDHDVIEAVLRANLGAVDATIDQLLAMSTDNQNERLRQEMEQKEPHTETSDTKGGSKIKTTPTISNNDRLPDSPMKTTKNWAPPLLGPLPPTFLRLLPSVESRLTTDTDLEDERIAMFLQNEEFMAELRWNKEFLTALDSEQNPESGKTSKQKGYGTSGQGQGQPNEDDMFKERIKHMGKLSRKKFAQLTKVFTWQGNKKGGGARHGPVTDSLLLQEEHSDDDEPRRKQK